MVAAAVAEAAAAAATSARVAAEKAGERQAALPKMCGISHAARNAAAPPREVPNCAVCSGPERVLCGKRVRKAERE